MAELLNVLTTQGTEEPRSRLPNSRKKLAAIEDGDRVIPGAH